MSVESKYLDEVYTLVNFGLLFKYISYRLFERLLLLYVAMFFFTVQGTFSKFFVVFGYFRYLFIYILSVSCKSFELVFSSMYLPPTFSFKY